MAPTFDDLFTSPDYYLHSFEDDSAIFLPMDRAAYHRSIFLDGRISPAGDIPMRLPVSGLLEQVPPPAQSGWIFHVAHCGSTLLARGLDQLSTNLVLREPSALRQLAFTPDQERLALVVAMISKRYQANMPTIIKTNVPVNFLLEDLAGLISKAPAIFIHLGLRDFLFASLRNERHRQWLRRVTTQLSAHLGDHSASSDAERTAALWTGLTHAFATAVGRLPGARTLDGEAFFASPADFLKLAADHLGVTMSSEEVEARVGGPLFASYSKIPEMPFNNETRLAQRAELEESLAAELEQAKRWVEERGGTDAAVKVIEAAAFQV